MEGPDLLRALMDRDGLNSNSLATRLRNKSMQSHVYRYLKGVAKEPKRETLRPIADHFGVPLAAFYDPVLAEQIAVERGLAGGSPAIKAPTPPQDTRPEVEQLASAIELITKALMNTDEFHRGLVRHSLSQLGENSRESVNISHKIADLLVTKPDESGGRHDSPRTTGKIGVLIGGSASKDLGDQHGESDRNEATRSAKK